MYISRIISKFIKGILLLIITRIIYKFIKKKIMNKNVKIEEVKEEFYTENNNALVIYEEPKKIRTKKYDVKEIYNNFFNGIKTEVQNDFGFKIKKDDNKPKNNFMSKKDNLLINDIKTNLSLKNDNKIIYSFETKKEYIYKIICNIKISKINKIEVVISNEIKDFIYEIDLLENINECGFILDNNNFLDDNIKITLIYYNKENSNNLLIDYIKFNLIEKCKDNYDPKINLPIIIFDVNKRYNPIYFKESNILNNISINNDTNELFFL